MTDQAAQAGRDVLADARFHMRHADFCGAEEPDASGCICGATEAMVRVDTALSKSGYSLSRTEGSLLDDAAFVLGLVESYMDHYGQANTSGERHADRKMRAEDIRGEIAAWRKARGLLDTEGSPS